MRFKDLHTLELVAHFLRQSNACCIAGFGIFRLEKQSSHIDPLAQKFQPMELIPIFTQGNYETSTNFISYCGSVWGLSYVESSQKINLQLELANHELLNHGKLHIEELGLFAKGQNGKIQFDFAKEKWTAASSFGLTGIRFIQENQKPKKILVDRTAKPGEHEDIEETRENALRELKQMLEDAGVDNNLASAPKLPKSKAFPILATVLTLILVINVVLFLQKHPQAARQSEIAKMNMADLPTNLGADEDTEVSIQAQNNSQKQATSAENNLLFNPGFVLSKGDCDFDSTAYFNDLSLFNLVSQDEVSQQPDQINTIAKLEKTIPQVAPNKEAIFEESPKEIEFKSSNKSAKLPNNNLNQVNHSSNNSSGYYLIIGAFGNYDNAVNQQNTFKEKGFEQTQLLPSNKKGMTLVALQKTSSENEATDLKNTFESQGIECWIYQKH